MRRSPLPLLVLLSFFACKKDPPPPPVIETPPAPVETAPVELAPLVEDAGADADASDGAVKKATGGGSTAASRMKQCCNALRTQAKNLGPSPEAAQLQTIATVCDQAASGTAPEFAPLKSLMAGKNVPPVCQF